MTSKCGFPIFTYAFIPGDFYFLGSGKSSEQKTVSPKYLPKVKLTKKNYQKLNWQKITKIKNREREKKLYLIILTLGWENILLFLNVSCMLFIFVSC